MYWDVIYKFQIYKKKFSSLSAYQYFLKKIFNITYLFPNSQKNNVLYSTLFSSSYESFEFLEGRKPLNIKHFHNVFLYIEVISIKKFSFFLILNIDKIKY